MNRVSVVICIYNSAFALSPALRNEGVCGLAACMEDIKGRGQGGELHQGRQRRRRCLLPGRGGGGEQGTAARLEQALHALRRTSQRPATLRRLP